MSDLIIAALSPSTRPHIVVVVVSTNPTPPPPAQIQRFLVRNNQTQRFSQRQALRLHQGLVTSTAEQVAPSTG